jgi:hypothetical protein
MGVQARLRAARGLLTTTREAHVRFTTAKPPLHVAADAHFARMKAAVLAAMKASRRVIDLPSLQKAIKTGDKQLAETAVLAVPSAFKAKLKALLPPILKATLIAGGDVGASLLKGKLRTASRWCRVTELNDRLMGRHLASPGSDLCRYHGGSPARLRTTAKPPDDFEFDPEDEMVQAWIEEHAAELADQLANTTEEDVAATLDDAFDAGELDDLEETIVGIAEDADRSATIAMNEVMTSVMEGQRQSWKQATDEGYLKGDEVRQWNTADAQACDDCDELDGETADMDQDYPGNIYGPPLHPNCRCYEVLVDRPSPRATSARVLGDKEGHEFHGNQWDSSHDFPPLPQGPVQVTGKFDFTAITDRRFLYNPTTNKLVLGEESPSDLTEASHGEIFEVLGLTPKEYDQYEVRGWISRNAGELGGVPNQLSVVISTASQFGDEARKSDVVHSLLQKIIANNAPEDTPIIIGRGSPTQLRQRLRMLEELKMLGDKEGHEFHGNQWDGKSLPTPSHFFHGSIITAVESIRKNGILSGADVDILNKTPPSGYVPSENHKVYLTENIDVAKKYAGRDQAWSGPTNKNTPVIFEVNIPPEHVSKLVPEDYGPGITNEYQRAATFPTSIPPEWIGRAFIFTPHLQFPGDRSRGTWAELKAAAATKSRTFYAVVFVPLIDDALKTLGDKAGHEFHGNQWHDPEIASLVKRLGTTTDPHQTQFLLSDGTRLAAHYSASGKTRLDSHATAVSDTGEHDDVRLYHFLDKGIIRYIPDQGVETTKVPTTQQAQVIADDWNHTFKRSVIIDVTDPKTGVLAHESMGNDRPINADALRNWIRSKLEPKTAGDKEGHEFHGNQWDAKNLQPIHQEVDYLRTFLDAKSVKIWSRAAGDHEGHEFHGNQWSEGVIHNKDGVVFKVVKTTNDEDVEYTIHDQSGQDVGSALIEADRRQVMINESHQRQGLASALYDYIEKDRGESFKPEKLLTKEGVAFWKSRAPKTLGDKSGHDFHGNQWNTHGVTVRSISESLDRDSGSGEGTGVVLSLPADQGSLILMTSYTPLGWDNKQAASSSNLTPLPPGYADVFNVSVNTERQGDGFRLYDAALQHVQSIGLHGIASWPPTRSDEAKRFWTSLESHGAKITRHNGWDLLTKMSPEPKTTSAFDRWKLRMALDAGDYDVATQVATEAEMRIGFETLGGVGSGITGHTTAHDKAVREHEKAVKLHQESVENQRPEGHEAPTIVSKVKDAIPLILAGKIVEMKNVHKVNTLLTKLAAITKDAVKRGKDAPNYDACKITVNGVSVFCGGSLRTKEYPNGMPRVVMPQLGGEPVKGSQADKLPKDDKGRVDAGPEFLDHLDKLGIGTKSESVVASHLIASQNELVGPQIAKRVAEKEYTPTSPIFISRDNYVVDGHHRWAAVVGQDAKDNKLGNLKIRVIRLDAPISEILHIAKKWSVKYGLPGASGTKVKRAAGDNLGHEFHGNQWDEGAWFISGGLGHSIDALPRHSNEVLASHPGFEGHAIPLHMVGVSTRSPAWTDDKPEVEAAFGSFSEAVAHGTPVEMNIDDLSTYQTFVSGVRLHELEERGVDFSKATGVVFDHGGHHWLVDGNHRTTIAQLAGRKTVNLIKIQATHLVTAAQKKRTSDQYEPSILPVDVQAWLDSLEVGNDSH